MGLKSLLKGLDPTTPKLASVALPGDGDSDAGSFKSRRPSTPSIIKKRLFSSFRSKSPIVRTNSASTTSSTLSSLQDGDTPPLSASDDDRSEQFFRIAPETPTSEYITPVSESPTRRPTPSPPSRFATPKPPVVSISRSGTPVSPAFLPHSPAPALHPHSPYSSRSYKPPLTLRASTPAPPRTPYELPRQPRRASTPAPAPPSNASSHTTPVTSPQPNANNALVPIGPHPYHAELHWQLLQHDPARGKPRLIFDVAQDPALIRIFVKYLRPLMPDDKHKLAANIPITEMTIRCAPLPLPAWDIRVRRRDGGALRCADVFMAIHESLYTPLSTSEKGQWAKEYLESCEPFFKARCTASTALTDWEERQGLRRVDLLKGRTIFKGIARAAPEKGYWVLHLDKQR